MLAQPQDTYLASRNEALHQVESTIRELGGIFQQLAHMVSLDCLHLALTVGCQVPSTWMTGAVA